MMQKPLSKHCFALIALHLICASVSAQHYALPSQIMSPGMTNSQGEEVINAPTGFVAAFQLDDQKLQTLVQQGSIAINIPQHLMGRVEAVVLRRPVVFKDIKVKSSANARLNGQQLIVDVDQSVLERIGYQPVQLSVYETHFSSVVLRYVAGRDQDMAKSIGNTERDSPLLTVRLKSGNGIVGKIRDIQQLKFDSTMGDISVKLSRVSKIQFQDNGLLNVEMRSGDLVSGKVDEREFVLINRWGTETIPLKDISEVTRDVLDNVDQ